MQCYRNQKVFEIVNEEVIEDQTVDIDEENIKLDFLLKCIQELPDRYRLVFNLYVLDGYSHNEISNLLKITSGTSKSNLARARLILKEKINAYKQISNKQSL